MKLKLLLLSALISLAGTAHAQRIVVLTPDTADIVAALGALDEIVGRDQTVQNPALKNKPSIGIHRRLTVEPIVAAKPDIAIGSWMAQPADIFAHLQKAGIKAVNVAPDDSIAAYPQSIRNIGQLIGKSAQADKLAGKWQAGYETAAFQRQTLPLQLRRAHRIGQEYRCRRNHPPRRRYQCRSRH